MCRYTLASLVLSLGCLLMFASGCSSSNYTKYPATQPNGQTTPVANADDAADDPALWVHPTTPSQSYILGTDKQVGLVVYDLEGRTIQSLPVGRLNNVDVRQGIMTMEGSRVDIAAGSHRDAKGVSVFLIDPANPKAPLREVPGSPFITSVLEPYGLCIAQIPGERGARVFVNDKNGLIEEWHVDLRTHGSVASRLVATRKLSSQVEGMVADEETGLLFVGEEAKGIWSFPLDAARGTTPTLIASTSRSSALRADVEGLAIAKTGPQSGYLLCSSQGDFTFAAYDRAPPHAYVGSFVITANQESLVGSVEETDGIEVFVGHLGSKYPDGIFIAQDGHNEPHNQNFKMVTWSSIMSALESSRQHSTLAPGVATVPQRTTDPYTGQ